MAPTEPRAVADIDITSISIDGDVATVEVLEDGERLTMTVVYDGTSWRIDDIQSR